MNIKKLNCLNLQKTNSKKFPLLKILKVLPDRNTLFETVVVSANDELVNLFLKKKITYLELHKKLLSIINFKEFKDYINKKPLNLRQIHELNNSVRLKIRELCI